MNDTLHIVTVTYNSEKHIRNFIKCLENSLYISINLIIIDNNSCDRTLSEIQKSGQLPFPLTLIKNSKNVGIAAANNTGIKKCIELCAEHIILANNDILFCENYLKELLSLIFEHKSKLATTVCLNGNSNIIWNMGGSFNRYTAKANYIDENKDYSRNNYSDIVSCNSGTTCLLYVNIEVFRNVGLMDEDYFVYYDDTDFLIRCEDKGYFVDIFPRLSLKHFHGASSGGGLSEFSIYELTKNRIILIRKNFNILQKLTAFTYVLFTRFILILFSKNRIIYIKGIKDGFAKKI